MSKLALAIETSCDETALAVYRYEQAALDGQILGEVVSSQSKLHALYGGVVPELAAREHMQNLPMLLRELMAQSGTQLNALDFVAVTRGPGLLGCLLMGVQFARGVAFAHALPVVGVNHIEGHILSCKLDNPELEFPYLCLVVSGGHTEIHLVHDAGKYELVARTIDDAAGEAFDKSANLLGFDYPGGAKLAALADSVGSSEVRFPRVMRESEGFSFSGLKTAIALTIQRAGALNDDLARKAELSFAVQEAIVDALCFKLKQALKQSAVSRVGVCGGVSANRALREAVSTLPGVKAYFPKSAHCIDNAAMIAYAGALRFESGERLAANAELYPRWAVEKVDCL